MSENGNESRSTLLQGFASLGGRAAAATLRPLTEAVGAAAEAGFAELRTIDRLLESGDLERLMDSERLQIAARQVLGSDGAKQLLDALFDSGLVDRFIERLLASDGLRRAVDQIAESPAVTQAIEHHGLSFADQLGDELRARSRTADDRLEHIARRLIRREAEPPAGEAA